MAITHMSLIVTTITRGTRQLKSLSSGLDKLGSVAATVGMAAAGLAAVFAGMTFKTAIEKSMQLSDELQALKAATGATAEEFEKMKELGFELGESMGAFTTPQAIESMKILAFAGFETNQILEATPQILKLASAGMVDLATATDITASVIRSFGMDASEATEVVDILTKTFVSTNTMMDQLGEAMSYVNPVAAALGFELEEVATSLGILANAGIKSSKSGTTMRAILIRLAAPTTQARKAINELGLELFETTPAAEALNDKIKEQTGELSDLELQLDSTKAELEEFGLEMDKLQLKESKNTLEIMKIREEAASQRRDLTSQEESQIEALELANDRLSISQKEISIQMDEASLEMEIQKNKAEDLTTEIDSLNDSLNGQQGQMKDMLSILLEFNEKMVGLSDAQKAAALNAIFGRRAIAGFMVLLNSVQQEAAVTSENIADVTTALDEMGVSESEVNAVTSDGIMTFQELQEMLQNSSGTANEMFDVMESGSGKQMKQFTSAIDTLLIKIGDQFTPVLINMTNVLKNQLIPASSGLSKVFAPIIGYLNRLGDAFMNLGRAITENETTFKALVILMGATYIHAIPLLGTLLLLAEGFILVTNATAEFIRWLGKIGVMEDIVYVFDIFKEALEILMGVIMLFVNAILPDLKKAFNDVKVALEEIKEAVPGLIEFLQGGLLVILLIIPVALTGIVIAVLAVVWALAKLTQFIAGAVRMFLRFDKAVDEIIQGVLSDLKDRFDLITDAISDIIDYLKWLDERFGITATFIKEIINPAINGMTIAWRWLKKGMEDFINFVNGIFMVVFNFFMRLWKGAVKLFEEDIPQGLEKLRKGFINMIPQQVKDAVEFLVDEFQKLVDFIERVIDGAKEMKDNITGFELGGTGGETIGSVGGKVVSAITPFADGGMVTKPTFALIGENGPEAVVPLNQNTGSGSIPNMGTNIYSNDTINVSVNVDGNMDESKIDQIMDTMIQKIEDAKRNKYNDIINAVGG